MQDCSSAYLCGIDPPATGVPASFHGTCLLFYLQSCDLAPKHDVYTEQLLSLTAMLMAMPKVTQRAILSCAFPLSCASHHLPFE